MQLHRAELGRETECDSGAWFVGNKVVLLLSGRLVLACSPFMWVSTL